MEPCFPPECYSSLEVFQKESLYLFPNTWTCVGFTFDVSSHQDYIAADVGKYPILVQNFNGVLKAFLNVCTHRFSHIQKDERGNRPLVCPYHGWFFDENGRPKGIPDRNCFSNLDAAKLDSLKLEPWDLAVCGVFIFVKKMDSSLRESLEGYLGDNFSVLLDISDALGPRVGAIESTFACNWKVVLENAIEQYHVGPVHPKTFGRLGLSDGAKNIVHDSYHSYWTMTVSDETLDKWNKLQAMFESRPLKYDGFFHVFLFPNLAVGTTFGASFSISLISPVSADQTRFRCFVFGCKLNNISRQEKMIAESYWRGAYEFNKQVFEEDRIACEGVQKGCHVYKGTGIISNQEKRVYYFQSAYTQWMKNLGGSCEK